MEKNGVDEILFEASENRIGKEYVKALDKYNQALYFLAEEDKIDVYFEIADIYSLLGAYDKSNEAYKKILEIDEQDSGAWYGVAYTSELLQNNLDEALLGYEKALEYDPNYKEAYYYAATIYGDLGDEKKALEYLMKVVELDPEDFIAYNDIGSIYEGQGKLELAKKYLEKSIDINSSYYLSHFNLGVVYKAIGDYDKAIYEYKLAGQFSDEHYIYLNMSAIYIEEGKFEESVEILTEGIGINPHHILYYNRACSYRKLGEIGKALEDYEKAYKINEIVEVWASEDPDLMDIIGVEKW